MASNRTTVLDPPFTSALRRSITDLWHAATLNGGAVGFTPDTDRVVIERFATAELDHVEHGPHHLVVCRQGEGVVAMAILQVNNLDIMSHWMELKRFMVHPDHQGSGLGREFADAIAHIARTQFGLEQLYLTARSGQGTEQFWLKCGYQHVATLPKRVKLGENDYRDVVCMIRTL